MIHSGVRTILVLDRFTPSNGITTEATFVPTNKNGKSSHCQAKGLIGGMLHAASAGAGF